MTAPAPGAAALDGSGARKVILHEVGLRDGLQNPSVRDPSIEPKLKLLHLMHSLGIHAADIGLPGMRGPELAQEALALRPDLKVIFASG